MSKTMTEKQLTANRRNAEKSTSPKTAAGRAVSKLNALQHGILSKEVRGRGRHGQESSREYTALHERFRQDLQPVGGLEELLVDQIVTAHWRLRRALRAEAGEIALSVDEGQWQRSLVPHPTALWAGWEGLGGPIPTMQNSALGNALLGKLLGEVRAAVEREGELTEAAVKKLDQGFGSRANRLTRELEELRASGRENPEGLGATELPKRSQQQSLAYLDRELRAIAWRKEQCEKQEASVEAARQAAAVLPSVAVLDRILRYETTLERGMYRAMAQLERLQRMRRGEAVPAAVSVEVSGRV